MKKLLNIVLCIAVILSVAACGDKTIPPSSEEQISTNVKQETEDENTLSDNAVIIYFAYSENITENVDTVASASLDSSSNNTGNIQVMANTIKEKIGADIVSLKVSEPYNYNYDVMRERVYKENDDNINPALSTKIDNLEQYDTVFLGTPVWAGKLPPPMRTFIAENDLSGKTIIPFGIHLGSGWGSNINELQAAYPNAEFIDGLTVRADTTNNEVESETAEWLNKIGF